MSITPEQLAQAEEYEKEGMPTRAIAGLMGLPHSTLASKLKAKRDNSIGDLVGSTTEQGLNNEVQLRSLELDHERKMAELDIRQQELEVQRQKLSIQEAEAKNEQLKLQMEEREMEQGEEREHQRIESRKAVLVSKFNRLVNELLDSCQGATWESSDFEDYLLRADNLKERIQKFCAYHGIDEEELKIFQALEVLLAWWEQAKSEYSGFFSSDVNLDLDKKEVAKIRSWLVDDFDEIGVMLGTDENDAESDDDASNDEADDDDKEENEDDHPPKRNVNPPSRRNR